MNPELALLAHHLAPLQEHLAREDVVEIMVNPDGSVWVESHGEGMMQLDWRMDEAARLGVIVAVASAHEQLCGPDAPSVAATLPGDLPARFQGILPPLAAAPTFVLRLPTRHAVALESYVPDALSEEQHERLLRAVDQRENVLVVGGTGTGKTTLSGAILEQMARTGHRVLTIEDTPELRHSAPNQLALYVDRQRGGSYRQALFNALRLRPDRIIVGELRDGDAALELLKAWNTGHNGGLATLHANHPAAALARIEQLIAEVVPHPPRQLIAEAIDLIVWIVRATGTEDGRATRRVACISQVHNALDARGDYVLTPLMHPHHRLDEP